MKIFRVQNTGTAQEIVTIHPWVDEAWGTSYNEYHHELIDIEPQEGSVKRWNLMGDDLIEFKFTTAEYIQFEIGDFLFYNDERFILTNSYKPSDNTESGGYDYSLSFKADIFIANNRIFKLSGREQSWSLTSTLAAQLEQWVKNLRDNGIKHRYIKDGDICESEFAIDIQNSFVNPSGDIIGNIQKSMTYSKEYLVNAITKMAMHLYLRQM